MKRERNMSTDNNLQTDNEDNIEESDEIEESIEDDPRLIKMVERLKKQAKISAEKLEGKTLEEQYDLLEFYLDNKPKRKRTGNKPVVPVVTLVGETDKGYTLLRKTPDSLRWQIDLINVLNKKK